VIVFSESQKVHLAIIARALESICGRACSIAIAAMRMQAAKEDLST
jgi:hypothetical protein